MLRHVEPSSRCPLLQPLSAPARTAVPRLPRQERPEKEAFATELRDTELCPDAAHWRLEGPAAVDLSDDMSE